MTHHVLSRASVGFALAIGLLSLSLDAYAAPIYLECKTADGKEKKAKTMAFTLDETAQTVSGALGAMDGSYAGPSPNTERNLSAASESLGGAKQQSVGVNLRSPQTRKAVFSVDRVEFNLLQPSGGEATAVSFVISRVDLSIQEKYPLMKARTGICKIVEPEKRAF